MRWIVKSEMRDGVPDYYVYDTKLDARVHGGFDCEKTAQIFADYLNNTEVDDDAEQI